MKQKPGLHTQKTLSECRNYFTDIFFIKPVYKQISDSKVTNSLTLFPFPTTSENKVIII